LEIVHFVASVRAIHSFTTRIGIDARVVVTAPGLTVLTTISDRKEIFNTMVPGATIHDRIEESIASACVRRATLVLAISTTISNRQKVVGIMSPWGTRDCLVLGIRVDASIRTTAALLAS
jgi:hypothetical protein